MNSIIFLTYDEPNAEKNWAFLQKRFPHAKRVGNVPGILNAHQECARVAESEYFFVVDGDNEVLDSFEFTPPKELNAPDTVYVWRCKNPVNDLIYGYGAIKLYSKNVLLTATASVDIATSVGKKYEIVNQLASITHFNTSPLNAWRSAFRECTKLSSQIISSQPQADTQERLDSWCSVGEDREYGKWCIAGARAGRKFGTNNKHNPEALMKINDFSWLKQLFEMMKHGTKRL